MSASRSTAALLFNDDFFSYFYPRVLVKWSYDSNGNISFTCQHGPRECDGNKIMACALDHLKDDPDLQALMMTCMMSESDPPTAGMKVKPT